MTNLVSNARGSARAAFARALALLGLWIVLIGAKPADLAIGLVTIAAATWTSLHLLAPSGTRVRLGPLLALALRFLWQSVVAGCDVARRALHPQMPLHPGFVAYPVRLQPGPARNAFIALTSLLPGTVPTGDQDGALLYHCLDTERPVVAELAAEEAAFSRVLRP